MVSFCVLERLHYLIWNNLFVVKSSVGVASHLISHQLAQGIPHKLLGSHSQPATECVLSTLRGFECG